MTRFPGRGYGTEGLPARFYLRHGGHLMEKLSEDFKARQRPVARILIAVSALLAGFLIMLFRLIRKP